MSILGCGVLQGLGAWDAAIKCSVLANISRQYVDHLAVYIYIYTIVLIVSPYCIYIYICYTYIDTKVIFALPAWSVRSKSQISGQVGGPKLSPNLLDAHGVSRQE